MTEIVRPGRRLGEVIVAGKTYKLMGLQDYEKPEKTMTKKAAKKLSDKTVVIFNRLNPAMREVLGPKPTKADGIAALAVLLRMARYAARHYELGSQDRLIAEDLCLDLEATEGA